MISEVTPVVTEYPQCAYVIASQNTVQELQSSNHDQEEEENINELGSLWRLVHVVIVDVLKHLVPVLRTRLWNDRLRLGRHSARGGGSGCGLRDGSNRGRRFASVLLRRHLFKKISLFLFGKIWAQKR